MSDKNDEYIDLVQESEIAEIQAERKKAVDKIIKKNLRKQKTKSDKILDARLWITLIMFLVSLISGLIIILSTK